MKFIKRFSSIFNQQVRTIILVAILAYVVFQRLGNTSGFLNALEVYTPLAFVVIGLLYLAIKGKGFAAHLATLAAFFLSTGSSFVNSLLSFRFDPFGFANPLDFGSIIDLVAFLYLLLMSISLFLNKDAKAKNERKDLLLTAIIAGLFFYFRGGFDLVIDKLMLPVISLLFGAPLSTILFLAAGVIDVPFNFVDTILNTPLLSIPISYWLFSLFAFYLIFGAIKGILGELKK
ncbi:hypothetical protein BK011_06880 [Tenericutes bacterium MZ-XQ]|nr:hypothetical protein BK011_06880 [Tenericutes bacterium MZ-XQ]